MFTVINQYINTDGEPRQFLYDPDTATGTIIYGKTTEHVFEMRMTSHGLTAPPIAMHEKEWAWLLGCWAMVTMIYGNHHVT
jgi:hypothetical protein